MFKVKFLLLLAFVSVAFSQDVIKFQIPTDSSGAPAPAPVAPAKPDTVKKLGPATGMPLNLEAISAKDTASFETYSIRLALINDSIAANYRTMETVKKNSESTMPKLEPKGEFEKQAEFDVRQQKWQDELKQRMARDTKSHTDRLEQLEKAKAKIISNQAALYGSVEIKTNPSAVSILIDKEEVGVSPMEYKMLIPGTRNISLRREGLHQYDTTLQVASGAKFKLSVELEEKSIFSQENEISFVKILSKDTTIQGYEARIKIIESRIAQIDGEIKGMLDPMSRVMALRARAESLTKTAKEAEAEAEAAKAKAEEKSAAAKKAPKAKAKTAQSEADAAEEEYKDAASKAEKLTKEAKDAVDEAVAAGVSLASNVEASQNQRAELQEHYESYRGKLERSIAVLKDYIVAARSAIMGVPALGAKIELGAYDAESEAFALAAQDTASEKYPFLFSGKVVVPRDVAVTLNRSAPGFATTVQFINYPFETDSSGSVNLAMKKLLLSNGGQELKVEGVFSEIGRYKAVDGYGAWKLYADSLLSGALKAQGLDYKYAMGSSAAKEAAKKESSGSGLGWRGWTRIVTFTGATVFGTLGFLKNHDYIKADNKRKELENNLPPLPLENPRTTAQAEWIKEYDSNDKKRNDSNVSRIILFSASGVLATVGVITFFF
jgi:hypothetical protein